MTLKEFQEKLEEYASNNMSAFMGKVQVTKNEADDLRDLYKQLTAADQPKALEMLKKHKVDVSTF